MEQNSPTNGGHVLVDAARRAGTTAVFAIHGVQIEPIFQACADLDVDLVDVRHEGSAGFAAEAFSRVTGALGVAAVCPGPGLTNVLTSMTNALLDRNAVLYVVGSTPESTLETNGLQVGIDHVALAAPITKWACKVHSIDQLERIVAQAIRIATTAPRRAGVARHPGRCARCGGDALRRVSVSDCRRGAERGGGRCVPRTARRCLTARGAARRRA